MSKWTTGNMPALEGRNALVTGTGGLGFEIALALAAAGAEVILAGRSPDKGAAAVAAIVAKIPTARVRFGRTDLADLGSVAGFAADLVRTEARLDLLVANAGVMTPPDRRVTRDGFELQFGTNHLGHFALTAGLMPLLKRGRAARVVSVGSIAARRGRIDLDDLQSVRGYHPMTAYGQSKLACLMFALELSRRSRAAGWGVAGLAAHPGVSRTDLLLNGPGRRSVNGVLRRALWFLFQPAAQGALPILYAATDPAARDGGYYGPDRLAGTRGHPVEEAPPRPALEADVAARLWEASEALTGARFD